MESHWLPHLISTILLLFTGAYAGCGLLWCPNGKESACQCRRLVFDPWVGKIAWRRKWEPTPVSLPGKSHGQRSLAGSGVANSQTQLGNDNVPVPVHCVQRWVTFPGVETVALKMSGEGTDSADGELCHGQLDTVHTAEALWLPSDVACLEIPDPGTPEYCGNPVAVCVMDLKHLAGK